MVARARERGGGQPPIIMEAECKPKIGEGPDLLGLHCCCAPPVQVHAGLYYYNGRDHSVSPLS
jgi:hypothetical protein